MQNQVLTNVTNQNIRHPRIANHDYPNIFFPGHDTASYGISRSELAKYDWHNPYGRNIPIIPFDAGCAKCHGSGIHKSSFSRTPLPCVACYERQGYCKKCLGTGLHYRKDAVCTACRK